MEQLPSAIICLILSHVCPMHSMRRLADLSLVCRLFRKAVRSMPVEACGAIFDASRPQSLSRYCMSHSVCMLDLSYCSLTANMFESFPASLEKLNLCCITSLESFLPLDPLYYLPNLSHLDVSCWNDSFCRNYPFLVWSRFPSSLTSLTCIGTCVKLAGLLCPQLKVSSSLPSFSSSLRYIRAAHVQHMSGSQDKFDGQTVRYLLHLVRCSPHLVKVDLSGWFPLPSLYSNSTEIHPVSALIEVLNVHSASTLQYMKLRRCARLTLDEMRFFIRRFGTHFECDDCPRAPQRCLSQVLLDWIHQISSDPFLVTRNAYVECTDASSSDSPLLPVDVEEFFSKIRYAEIEWSFNDSVDPKLCFASHGGRVAISFVVERGVNNQIIRLFDAFTATAEGNGYLYCDPTCSWHVFWDTSEACIPHPLHKFLTLEEYLEIGVKCDFSWYWPVSFTNRWILCKRLRQRYLCKE